MSEALYWQVSGRGRDLVLVHGWGMNGAVWQQTVKVLDAHFRVHVVDLPGYGHSAQCHAQNLEEIALLLMVDAPKDAIWVGWSLGGLVSTHMALHHTDYVNKLVTVASSPKFSAEKEPVMWRGIEPYVLRAFAELLLEDFQTTIERFMALQAMGSPSARQDVKRLKQAVLSRPLPDPDSLLAGLKMLSDVDLRAQLAQISVPMLRLYGRLDGLVPIKVAKDLDKALAHTEQYIFTQSSHAPFVTETDAFCEQLLSFADK